MLVNRKHPSKPDILTISKRSGRKLLVLATTDGCGYKNLKIQIIDQVEVGNCKALEEAEVYWQNPLRTLIQNGGNAHCRKKEKV